MTKEEIVLDFFETISSCFNEDELKTIKEIYETIKPTVGESLYRDVASACVTAVLEKKNDNLEFNSKELIDYVKDMLSINNSDHELIRIRELKGNDLIMNTKDNDHEEVIINTYDSLDCSRDLRNAVFFDLINGESELFVAKKYRLTSKEVKSIYRERLNFAKAIFSIDDEKVNKEVEAREPIKSNVKILIDFIK